MKTFIIVLFMMVPLSLLCQPKWDFSVNYLFESSETAYFDPPDRFSGLGGTVLIQVSALWDWGDYFIGGPYASVAPGVEIFRFDESTTLLELGLAIGPRFTVFENHQIIGLAQIGYREWLVSDNDLSSNGLATNFNVIFQFNKESSISPQAEIGFLAQPTGGNDDFFISFEPYIYVGGGIIYTP